MYVCKSYISSTSFQIVLKSMFNAVTFEECSSRCRWSFNNWKPQLRLRHLTWACAWSFFNYWPTWTRRFKSKVPTRYNSDMSNFLSGRCPHQNWTFVAKERCPYPDHFHSLKDELEESDGFAMVQYRWKRVCSVRTHRCKLIGRCRGAIVLFLNWIIR